MVVGVSYRYAHVSLVHMGHILECSAHSGFPSPFSPSVSTSSAPKQSLALPETSVCGAHGRVDHPFRFVVRLPRMTSRFGVFVASAPGIRTARGRSEGRLAFRSAPSSGC